MFSSAVLVQWGLTTVLLGRRRVASTNHILLVFAMLGFPEMASLAWTSMSALQKLTNAPEQICSASIQPEVIRAAASWAMAIPMHVKTWTSV
jgi:hypothetical protein